MTEHPDLRRRQFIVAATAGVGLPGLASAQASYPSRTITFVCPFSVGGPTDALARIWADFAAAQLGGAVVVENRLGANGTIAAAYVAKQPADGHTLLLNTGSISLSPFSYKTLQFKNSDFDSVGLLGTASQVLIANPKLGVKSVADLVKLAKAKPGALAYGTAGIGNSTHLNTEILARHHGVKFLNTPYKGTAQALLAVMSGEVSFCVDVATTAVAQSQAGKVVPLAIFGRQRLPDLPNVPTVYELGLKDSVDGGWYGISAPAGTPRAVLEKLNATTVAMWEDTRSRARLQAANFQRMPDGGVDGVKKLVERDTRVFGPLITDLGIRND